MRIKLKFRFQNNNNSKVNHNITHKQLTKITCNNINNKLANRMTNNNNKKHNNNN